LGPGGVLVGVPGSAGDRSGPLCQPLDRPAVTRRPRPGKQRPRRGLTRHAVIGTGPRHPWGLPASGRGGADGDPAPAQVPARRGRDEGEDGGRGPPW
jgi:hypothetical protein